MEKGFGYEARCAAARASHFQRWMMVWALRRRASRCAGPGGSRGKEEGVLKGAVEKSVGGEGSRRRHSEGKVWAWMSKSNGEGRIEDAARPLREGRCCQR